MQKSGDLVEGEQRWFCVGRLCEVTYHSDDRAYILAVYLAFGP